ncbi:MAG: GFA family protein [Polyangiaceae bacterium]
MHCSICRRAGWVLAMAPGTSFRLISGESELTDYQFGKKHLHHPFCRTCGARTFSRGTGKDGVEMVALNLRCVDGVDVTSLSIETFDGASLLQKHPTPTREAFQLVSL